MAKNEPLTKDCEKRLELCECGRYLSCGYDGDPICGECDSASFTPIKVVHHPVHTTKRIKSALDGLKQELLNTEFERAVELEDFHLEDVFAIINKWFPAFKEDGENGT